MTPEVIPPRVPQFNWVDLGLPSGTLWLDRVLGADSVGDPGYWYQWAALVGYKNPAQYDFSLANYEEQGLNLITDLTGHDAAAVYYGGTARIPELSQIRELLENTTVIVSDSVFSLRSNINGNLIKIPAMGAVNGHIVSGAEDIFLWARDYYNESRAEVLFINTEGEVSYTNLPRYYGVSILPVKSS